MARNLREGGRHATGRPLGRLWDGIAMAAKMRNCPYCGFRIPRSAKKCGHCREWIVRRDVSRQLRQSISRSEPWSPKKIKKTAFIVIGIVISVAYFGSFNSLKVQQDKTPGSSIKQLTDQSLPLPMPPPPGSSFAKKKNVALTSVETAATPKVKELRFETEIARFSRNYRCPKRHESISPASSGMGPLYGCVDGAGETAKYWINGRADGQSVENIKVMWNDWRKDGGFGVHADATEATKMLNVLGQLYLPDSLGELRKMFKGATNKSFSRAGYVVEYRYSRGPAIDERVVILTPIGARSPDGNTELASPTPSIVETVAKAQKQDPVLNAYAICEVLDSTGVTSGKCSVSGWKQSIDISIDTSGSEAMQICHGIVGMINQKGIQFDRGWQIRIFSPFSGDRTIAYCKLS